MKEEKSLYIKEENRAKVIFEFGYYEDRQEIQAILNCGEVYRDLDEIYNMVRSQLKHGDEELSPKIENLLESIKELAFRDY